MAASSQSVVVWDPEGKWWRGAIADLERARELRRRGVALLPVEVELMRLNGLGGFAERSWGAGWAIPLGAPQSIAKLCLYVFRDLQAISWCARLAPTRESLTADGKPEPLRGQLRLIPDTSQHGVHAAELSATERGRVDLDSLGEPDELGGWTVGGVAHARPILDGFAGFALHGSGRGLKVLWAAVSQTRADHPGLWGGT